MNKAYCVYYLHKTIWIASDVKQVTDNSIVIKPSEIDKIEINTAIDFIFNSDAGCINIIYHNVEECWKAFCEQFLVIEAAGGLVKNEKAEYLFINRLGKWDLPKGKLDDGESIEQCAVREVYEETGLKNIQLKEYLTTTYHIYLYGGTSILKKSVWYKMFVTGHQYLIPQVEEDITEVKWFNSNNWQTVLKNTYPNIADVLKIAKQSQ
ncbi:NUDIX hydrolase [Polluticaenibacter yanchengensis]|uniref:NUDIX domain-containing protein n=1 Tax=Polluticaenibacter yanchengensis TaxID=3014562 RepID=A0ABT4UMJ4_9BACT|nr:NUDIX domain-containing protein [Chitinophagaceae bacterium LY-5]